MSSMGWESSEPPEPADEVEGGKPQPNAINLQASAMSSSP